VTVVARLSFPIRSLCQWIERSACEAAPPLTDPKQEPCQHQWRASSTRRGLTARAAQPIGFNMDAQRHKVRPHYPAAAHAAPETPSVVIPTKAGIALSVV
jgi:hypothetical protein